MTDLWDAIDETDGDVREQSFFGEDLSAVSLGHVEFEDCTFESCSFADLRRRASL